VQALGDKFHGKTRKWERGGQAFKNKKTKTKIISALNGRVEVKQN
jgi:hypothetical protein